MSSGVLRILAIVLAVGAILIGYIGYQTSQPASETLPVLTEQRVEQELPRYQVLVAARMIRAGQTLTDQDVKTLEVPHRPAYAYDVLDAVTDRITRVSIAADELIIADHFHETSPMVAAIGAGERAIAVRVDEVTGAGGFIEPGDKVDVLLFLPAGQETGNSSAAQRILSDIRVLAYGDALNAVDREAIRHKSHLDQTRQPIAESQQTRTEKSEDSTGKNSKTAVLAVTETDMSRLLLAESAGRLRLALLGTEQLPTEAVADDTTDPRIIQQQRVTLDAFNAAAKPKPVAVPVRRTQPAKSETKVKVLRGTQASTVTVAQEN